LHNMETAEKKVVKVETISKEKVLA